MATTINMVVKKGNGGDVDAAIAEISSVLGGGFKRANQTGPNTFDVVAQTGLRPDQVRGLKISEPAP